MTGPEKTDLMYSVYKIHIKIMVPITYSVQALATKPVAKFYWIPYRMLYSYVYDKIFSTILSETKSLNSQN